MYDLFIELLPHKIFNLYSPPVKLKQLYKKWFRNDELMDKSTYHRDVYFSYLPKNRDIGVGSAKRDKARKVLGNFITQVVKEQRFLGTINKHKL